MSTYGKPYSTLVGAPDGWYYNDATETYYDVYGDHVSLHRLLPGGHWDSLWYTPTTFIRMSGTYRTVETPAPFRPTVMDRIERSVRLGHAAESADEWIRKHPRVARFLNWATKGLN